MAENSVRPLIVAGLSLKNLEPRVWDPQSPYHLEGLRAVMVSYSDFHRSPLARDAAMKVGLHEFLGVPPHLQVYLDNGSFFFLRRRRKDLRYSTYEEFVSRAKPDWWPIPRDFIPHPKMTRRDQRDCLVRTMEVNRSYQLDGFVPVLHIGAELQEYVNQLLDHPKLAGKPRVALGGIVPNLLRAPRAMGYGLILDHLWHVRDRLRGKHLHLFGIGGTATLHLAAILGIDSVDSSGWRNRAARGIVQMPGTGDRMVAELGSWRGRRPSKDEWSLLSKCRCPACALSGIDGLKASGIEGFKTRATHNLWIIIQEGAWVSKHLASSSYNRNFRRRLDNSTYLPLIEKALHARGMRGDL